MQESDFLALKDKRLTPTDQWRDQAGSQWNYCLSDDGRCVICGGEPAHSTLEVPERIAEHLVEGIASEAFANNATLRRVILPPSVRFIGRKAFANCPQLEEVSFSEGLLSLGAKAFAQDRQLKELALPEGLLDFGAETFRSCENLAAISLPSTLTTIGPRAFIESGLERIELPASLTTLDSRTLLIHSGSHAGKTGKPLVIRVNEANPVFFVEGGVLCKREEDGSVRAVMYAGEEPVVRIPESVTKVSSCLFYGAAGVDELFVHDSVGRFGVEAFVTDVPIRRVHLSLSEPVEGHSTIDVQFSPTASARRSFMTAFSGGTMDATALIEAADQGLMFFTDRFEMGRAVLDRLEDPVLADASRIRYLKRLLTTNLKSISQEFARHNYHEGFDRLADQGILTPETIEEAMGYAREAGGVAAVGYLLEMKRERFSTSLMGDYDL